MKALRRTLPPWQREHLALTRAYHRLWKRAGRRPWTLLIFGYIIVGGLGLYYLGQLLSPNDEFYSELDEVVGVTYGVLLFGLGVLILAKQGHLLGVIASRATQAIARLHVTREWELIAVTPISRRRWLQAQQGSIAWQVFPTLRQILVITFLWAALYSGLLIYAYAELYPNRADILDINNTMPHPALYVLMVLPYGLLLWLQPTVMNTLLISVNLWASARTKRPEFSVMLGTSMTLITRTVLMAALVYGGLALTLFVAVLLEGPDFDGGDPLTVDIFVVFVGYLCFSILILAGLSLFLEAYPALIPLLFIQGGELTDLLAYYLTSLVVFGGVYGVLPLMMAQRFENMTVKRLEQREK